MAECFVTSIAQACNVVLILLCGPHNFGLSCSRKPKHAMASSPCWAFCNLHDATFTSPTYRASPYTDRNLFSARLSKMKGNAKSKPQILNPKWHALPHPSTNACKATQNPQNYWIFVSSRLAIEFFRNNCNWQIEADCTFKRGVWGELEWQGFRENHSAVCTETLTGFGRSCYPIITVTLSVHEVWPPGRPVTFQHVK